MGLRKLKTGGHGSGRREEGDEGEEMEVDEGEEDEGAVGSYDHTRC